MASATAGQYFSWSGVSCNTDLTIAIRSSVSLAKSGGLKRVGPIAEGVCAKAAGDRVTKSAVAPAASSFSIDDLRKELPPPAWIARPKTIRTQLCLRLPFSVSTTADIRTADTRTV